MTSEKHLHRPCPSCAGPKGETLYTAQFALIEGVPLTDEYDVVTCSRCGFAFADTTSTQADYDRYYAMHSKYEDAVTGTGGGLSPRDSERLRLAAEHIASLIPNKAARIADIGCANGGLLAALQKLGYSNLTGIDPSPACARAVASHQGITGITGSFSNLPAPQTPYDVVILTGVFEHVRDLDDALRATESVLAKDGQLYIAVPDAARYVDFLHAPFQEFNLEHINHFTVPSLNHFMEYRGYKTTAANQLPCDGAIDSEPVLFGLFQRQKTPAPPVIKTDHIAREKLRAYITASQRMMDQLQTQLVSLFAKYPKLILWGTGQLALKLVKLPGVDPARITAFVDSNPINQGRTLLGKPILSPTAIKDKNEPILPMTTLSYEPIARTIREKLAMPNEVLKLTLH